MKRESRHIVIPLSLWQSSDLSWLAKIILMEIDSLPRTEFGVNVRSGAIASELGISKKECDEALKELFNKGAFQVNVNEGQRLLVPLIYKDSYIEAGKQQEIEGEKPDPKIIIDFDEISTKWAETCTTLPPIKRWTPQRKRKVRACLKQSDLTVADLYKCFQIIASTPFVNGTGEFKAVFDWVIQRSQNLQKIYEGFYARSVKERRDYDRIMNIQSADDDLPNGKHKRQGL